MKDFSIIVAMDKNRGIGKGGGLPWDLPSDMKFFKETTVKAAEGKQNAVIMGRKTWESIPEKFRPLSDRLNVILTRNPDIIFPQGCLKAQSLDAAFGLLDGRDDIDQIFVIGGASIYDQAVHYQECHNLYITLVKEECDCDVYFPQVFDAFQQVSESAEICENNHCFSFFRYKKYAV